MRVQGSPLVRRGLGTARNLAHREGRRRALKLAAGATLALGAVAVRAAMLRDEAGHTRDARHAELAKEAHSRRINRVQRLSRALRSER